MSRSPLKQVTPVRMAVYVLAALASLALWVLPSMLGFPTAYDIAVGAGWFVLVTVLMLDIRRRSRRSAELLRTVYLDPQSGQAFSMATGLFPYRSGCGLISTMADIFAQKDAGGNRPGAEPPASFEAATIVRTRLFRLERLPGAPQHAHGAAGGAFRILQWQGVVQSAKTGMEYRFSCLSDLEDILCPLAFPEAALLTGPCGEVGSAACLVAPAGGGAAASAPSPLEAWQPLEQAQPQVAAPAGALQA